MKVLRKLLGNKLAVLGSLFILLFLLCAVFAPQLAAQDYSVQELMNTKAPPSAEHYFGTDDLGRDIFSGVVYGSRTSLLIGFCVLVLGGGIGTALGVLAGYLGGWVETVLMRMMDSVMAFPAILLALIFVSILGSGLKSAIIAVSIAQIPRFTRIVRSSVVKVKNNEYVAAAEVLGQSKWKILLWHILPNGMAPIIIQASLSFGQSLLIVSGLGFLGVGADPLSAEWGAMLSNARTYLMTAPHLAVFPGLAIAVTVLGFNLLGDGLRDALDTRDY